MSRQHEQRENGRQVYIRYDENLIDPPEPPFFQPGYWAGSRGFLPLDSGRGSSHRFEFAGQQYVLRRYLRGGQMARISHDHYLWTGEARSRPWREWSVLEVAISHGISVARPVAACVERRGLFYRAAIVTEYLAGTQTFAERLLDQRLEQQAWYQLGQEIRKLHQALIQHADLNANNILIDAHQGFHFIDFDKSKTMPVLGDWQWNPLYRLQRSLDKIQKSRPLRYSESDWQSLMDGYQVDPA